MEMTNHPNRSKSKERAVVVTTQHRGVFFGFAADTDGEIIKLRAARNCLYWPTENKGFMGLASMGPVKGARVGPAADISLRDITSVIECAPDAVTAWENAPWSC
jgi:hypothetical protein